MGTQLREATAERLSRSPLRGVPQEVRQILELKERERGAKAREDLTRRGQDISLLRSMASARAKKPQTTELQKHAKQAAKTALNAVQLEFSDFTSRNPSAPEFLSAIQRGIESGSPIFPLISNNIDKILGSQMPEKQRANTKKSILRKFKKNFDKINAKTLALTGVEEIEPPLRKPKTDAELVDEVLDELPDASEAEIEAEVKRRKREGK